MRYFVIAASLLLAAVIFMPLPAESGAPKSRELVFEGPWVTTNRKLDGNMTCVVKPLGDEKWQGRFFGVWQGVPFDYTVRFSGPPSDLRGTATIDGADYDWTGSMSEGRSFRAQFGGTRYTGHFEMQAKQRTAKVAAKPAATER